MIKKSLSFIFFIFCISIFSQNIIVKELESEIMETTRTLKIYIPDSYERDSIKNYPLAIVLDEEFMFDTYVGNSILFAKKDKVKSPEIKRRIKEQEKSFNYIANKGKFSKEQLMGVMFNGIKEQTGREPSQLFGMAGDASKIGALPAILITAGKFVLKAIKWVVQIIEKIAGLFKKNKSEISSF